MQDLESVSESGVLRPSVPLDIGARTQRQRIFGAMAQSAAEKTFSATTIADIVAHASISRATFYKHFDNKLACFHGTVDAFLGELRQVAADAHSRSADSQADAVREVVTAVMDHLAAKPDHAKLLLVEATLVAPEIVQRYRDLVIEGLESLKAENDTEQAGIDPETAFGSAMVLTAGYLGAGRGSELGSLTPELVYIALLPYAGRVAALEQARICR